MLRILCVMCVAGAVLATPAVAAAPAVVAPVMDDPNGGTPWSCAFNPFARIVCNGPSCWWVGEYQWIVSGSFTGVRCA